MHKNRKIVALIAAAVASVPMLAVSASPAHAGPTGVYFCYYEQHITTVGTDIPYVVPASITTQPYACPPGTITMKVA